MATIAASPADRKASERKFYSRMALFLVFLVLLGFGPSFYLRGIVPSYPRPNPTLPPAVILHGTIFTLWMAAIVAQTQLIAARKHEMHMRLGKLTMLLAILMIPVMYLTAVWQVARANQPPFTDPLTWTIVPLAVIIPFAVLVWNGWANRRDSSLHKRLMLSAAILVVMGPGDRAPPDRAADPSSASRSSFLLGLPLFIPIVRPGTAERLGDIHPATKLGFAHGRALGRFPARGLLARHLPWAECRRASARSWRLGRLSPSPSPRPASAPRAPTAPRLPAKCAGSSDARRRRRSGPPASAAPDNVRRVAVAGSRLIEIGPERADALGIRN